MTAVSATLEHIVGHCKEARGDGDGEEDGGDPSEEWYCAIGATVFV